MRGRVDNIAPVACSSASTAILTGGLPAMVLLIHAQPASGRFCVFLCVLHSVAFFGYAVVVLCVSHPFSLTSTKTAFCGQALAPELARRGVGRWANLEAFRTTFRRVADSKLGFSEKKVERQVGKTALLPTHRPARERSYQCPLGSTGNGWKFRGGSALFLPPLAARRSKCRRCSELSSWSSRAST